MQLSGNILEFGTNKGGEFAHAIVEVRGLRNSEHVNNVEKSSEELRRDAKRCEEVGGGWKSSEGFRSIEKRWEEVR